MRTDPAPRLVDIAMRVADGKGVDWNEEIERCPGGISRRQILALHALAEIRSQGRRPAEPRTSRWFLFAAVAIVLAAL